MLFVAVVIDAVVKIPVKQSLRRLWKLPTRVPGLFLNPRPFRPRLHGRSRSCYHRSSPPLVILLLKGSFRDPTPETALLETPQKEPGHTGDGRLPSPPRPDSYHSCFVALCTPSFRP